MNAHKTKKLSELVRIRRQYQRSIRLDADLGRMDALDGYVCHKTAADVLDAMAKQISGSNQRAFTWTGPFGGGKSSLAVALASALGPDQDLRARARDVLRLDSHPNFDEALPVRRGWLVLPVVGRRGFVSEEISKTLNHALGSNATPGSAAEVVADLCSAAADERYDGVLVVIDEMGKFLEAAVLGLGDDVYFFQDLAESAARAQGKIVVVGVLHQSFRQYASRLGSESRDDWAKVQGRYADIPLVAASDEVVELIGRAVETDARPKSNLADARAIASSMRLGGPPSAWKPSPKAWTHAGRCTPRWRPSSARYLVGNLARTNAAPLASSDPWSLTGSGPFSKSRPYPTNADTARTITGITSGSILNRRFFPRPTAIAGRRLRTPLSGLRRITVLFTPP